jgi:hypothetical protein
MSDQNKQPIKEFRAGTIVAAVWERTVAAFGKSVPQFSIRIQKRYRDDRSGEWKTTTYFRPDDMPKLVLVANRIFEYVMLKETEDVGGEVGTQSPNASEPR